MKTRLFVCVSLVACLVGCSVATQSSSKAAPNPLFAKAQKAAAIIAVKDGIELDISHPASRVNSIRVLATDGTVLEERAWIPQGTYFFWGDKDNRSATFIRDDAQEVLVITKGEDWCLSSVKIGAEGVITWSKYGKEINLYSELQDFADRGRSSYHEL